MKSYGRTVVALIVVLLITVLLSFEAPALKPDQSNYEQYGFWLQVEMAIGYFIAVTAGALVARRSFIVPALALAIFGWSLVVYILYDISRVDHAASFVDIAMEHIEGLILFSIAAVLGAILGKWIYEHEIRGTIGAS